MASKYMSQGSKTMDVGVKAPTYQNGMQDLIKEASGKTVGKVGKAGIAPGGLPKKGGGK